MNAGKYNHKIKIIKLHEKKDDAGFNQKPVEQEILVCYADVRTTKGFTMIANNSDFEKAYTNFTIRYPNVQITRDMILLYNDRRYTIEYLNNVDEKCTQLEIQAKEVQK